MSSSPAANPKPPSRKRLKRGLQAYAGKPVGVLVRSAAEMEAGADGQSVSKGAAQPHHGGLSRRRAAGRHAHVPFAASKDEEIGLGRREIYIHYGDGMAKSKLVVPAAKTGTARNMNTVATLAKMAADL